MQALGREAIAAASLASHSHLFLRRAVRAFVASRAIGRSNHLSCYQTRPCVPLATPLSSAALRMCHLEKATTGNTNASLKGVGDKSTSEDVKRVVEMAERASISREILHTNFLTPAVQKESMLALEKLSDIKIVAQGGYPQAERCRLSIGPPEELTIEPLIVAALSISGNFSFQCCSHSDFLGSILGTGIDRNKLGDIILQEERGAHVLIVPELVDFVTVSLGKVRDVPVKCKSIPLLALEYEPPRTMSFKTVEASLRIDAIASAGYKISRSKLVDLISEGNVRLNWVTITKSNTTVKAGDVISVRGRRRLKVGEINTTKKGKFAVELIRYL